MKTTLVIVLVVLVALVGAFFFFAHRGNPGGAALNPAGTESGSNPAGGGTSPTVTSTSTGGTGTTTPTQGATPPPVAGSGIQAEFFGMGTVNSNDFPPFSIGFLGHPTLIWASVEHSRGVYNWSGIDNYVNEAKSHGLVDKDGAVDISLTLGLTPGWAVSNQAPCVQKDSRTQCTVPPDNIKDWTDFLTAMMAHYNGVTEPHVKYFELWNEVTAPNSWTGTQAQMLQLAAAAYPIIHTDPYSELLTPSVSGYAGTGLARDGATWMTQYLQSGGSKYADGLAFHGYLYLETELNPYPWPESSDISTCTSSENCHDSITEKIAIFRGIMDANGMAGKPIFQTEGSWGQATISDPQQQMAWLARWLILQAGVSASDNLQATSWYTWGGGSAQVNGLQTYGDIENTGGTPTAAGLVYEEMYHWLIGATVSPCAANGSIWTCSLSRPNGYQGEIIWNGTTACTTASCPSASESVPSQFTNYLTLTGNKVTISNNSIPVSAQPILLQNQ